MFLIMLIKDICTLYTYNKNNKIIQFYFNELFNTLLRNIEFNI